MRESTVSRSLAPCLWTLLLLSLPVAACVPSCAGGKEEAGAACGQEASGAAARTESADSLTVPLNVTVVGGAFDGEVVALNQDAAFGFGQREVRFLPEDLEEWARLSFPVHVAFLRVGYWSADCGSFHPPAPISQEDSVRFWHELRALENRLGLDLFRPISLSEVQPGSRRERCGHWEPILPEGFIGVQFFHPSAFPARTPAGWTVKTRLTVEECSFGGCVEPPVSSTYVRFIVGELHGHPEPVSWVIHHEMLHALGFGHTCFFPSILFLPGAKVDGQTCHPNGMATEVTAYDVALVQLLYRRVHGG